MAAAGGMATIASLPLLPLVRIAEGLTDKDVRALCEAYPNLQATIAQLLPHAFPTEFVEQYFETPPGHCKLRITALSPDGCRVACTARSLLGGNPRHEAHSAFAGEAGGPLRHIYTGFCPSMDGAWFSGNADQNLVIHNGLNAGIFYAVMSHDGMQELHSVPRPIHDWWCDPPLPLPGTTAILHVELREDTGYPYLYVAGRDRVCLDISPLHVPGLAWEYCRALNHDATRLAIGYSDGQVSVWDATSGAHLFALPPHPSHSPESDPRTLAIAFSDTADVIATYHESGLVCTWRGVSPKPSHAFLTNIHDLSTYLVVRGNTILAVGPMRPLAIFVMDATTGNTHTFRTPAGYSLLATNFACTFTPDRTKLVIARAQYTFTFNLGHLAARLARPLGVPTELRPCRAQST